MAMFVFKSIHIQINGYGSIKPQAQLKPQVYVHTSAMLTPTSHICDNNKLIMDPRNANLLLMGCFFLSVFIK